MKYLFTVLFISSFLIAPTSYAGDCTITAASRILLSGQQDNGLKFKEIASSENCTHQQRTDFVNFIKKIKGTLHTPRLSQDISSLANATISPRSIRVEHLEDVLKEHLALEEHRFVTATNLVSSQNTISLQENQSLSASCQNCKSDGIKNIKVNIRSLKSNSPKELWVRATLKTQVEALVSVGPIRVNHQALSENQFKRKKILTQTPHEVIQSSDQLRFYRLNKRLDPEEPLMRSSLSPIRLVTQGTPVNISLENSNISLNGKAVPMSGAHHGDSVRLRHPRTNRIIIGKVVDYNKVVIDL